MHSIQWHTLKIQIDQHVEYHKVEFGLQHHLKFRSLRLPYHQTTYKFQHMPMTELLISKAYSRPHSKSLSFWLQTLQL